jgi:hypothetical protein
VLVDLLPVVAELVVVQVAVQVAVVVLALVDLEVQLEIQEIKVLEILEVAAVEVGALQVVQDFILILVYHRLARVAEQLI